MALKLLDTTHPFFIPRWRRILIVALIVIWACIEFAVGSVAWGALCAALAVYSGYQFFVVFKEPGTEPDGQD